MDITAVKEEHLDQAIAKAMGGEVTVANPVGVEAPASIPIHDSLEFPQDCRGVEPSKTTDDASPEELTRHAQYLEWQAGLLTGKATALRTMAAAR